MCGSSRTISPILACMPNIAGCSRPRSATRSIASISRATEGVTSSLRALVRTVLSRYLDVAPADRRFAPNRYGRPRVINAGQEQSGLCLNISHTQGLIAVGVTWHRELGVDVEHVRAREVSLEIADRFFARAEVGGAALVPPDQPPGSLLRILDFQGSLREGARCGPSIPLSNSAFTIHTSVPCTSPSSRNWVTTRRWGFWSFWPTRIDLLAVRRAPLEVPPTLTIRRTVPLVSEQVVQAQVLKSSFGEYAA